MSRRTARLNRAAADVAGLDLDSRRYIDAQRRIRSELAAKVAVLRGHEIGAEQLAYRANPELRAADIATFRAHRAAEGRPVPTTPAAVEQLRERVRQRIADLRAERAVDASASTEQPPPTART